MAVRISSGTNKSPSDTLEVMVDMPQPSNACVEAFIEALKNKTVKDTSEDSECLYEPRKRYCVSAMLQEAGFR